MSFGSTLVDHYPSGSYVTSLQNTILEMFKLVRKGHPIKWGPKEKWCVINGKTFNVPKSVWDTYEIPLQ